MMPQNKSAILACVFAVCFCALFVHEASCERLVGGLSDELKADEEVRNLLVDVSTAVRLRH